MTSLTEAVRCVKMNLIGAFLVEVNIGFNRYLILKAFFVYCESINDICLEVNGLALLCINKIFLKLDFGNGSGTVFNDKRKLNC